MAEINFEKSIAELESIVKTLEGGNLSLDEMVQYFERGIKLSAQCNKLLDEAEGKINVLVKKDGEITKQDFVPTED